jgi:hypothetical protein
MDIPIANCSAKSGANLYSVGPNRGILSQNYVDRARRLAPQMSPTGW